MKQSHEFVESQIRPQFSSLNTFYLFPFPIKVTPKQLTKFSKVVDGVAPAHRDLTK
jgi:hypothetical protein